jgi:hypothetical protein
LANEPLLNEARYSNGIPKTYNPALEEVNADYPYTLDLRRA